MRGRSGIAGAVVALAGALAAAMPAATAAQEAEELRLAVRGAGLAPCSAFSAAEEDKGQVFYAFRGWLDGYLTATNRYYEDTYDITSFEPSELIAAIMRRHCRANPADRVFAVVNAIVTKLVPDRLRTPSPPVTASAGGASLKLYRETLARAEAQLVSLGFLDEESGGVWSAALADAFTGFQRDRGLDATGLPDAQTLWVLFAPGGWMVDEAAGSGNGR